MFDNHPPFQIDGNLLSFVASVKQGQSKTYALMPSPKDRSAENSTLSVKKTRQFIEAGNEFIAVRFPGEGAKDFGAAGADAAQVPTPMIAWRPTGGTWMGKMRWAMKRKVRSYTLSVVRSGPACFEYEARYRFAPYEAGAPGEYVFRARLVPGQPLARITAELDGGRLKRNNADFLLLDLHSGWTPKRIGYVQQAGETTMRIGWLDLAKHLEEKKNADYTVGPSVGAEGRPIPPAKPERGLYMLGAIVPAGKWGGLKGGVVLTDDEKNDGAPGIGVVPLHAGSWRRAMALNCWGKDGQSVTVGLPLDARWVWWQYECSDERSPFSTHEHDEGLKPSYARRQWALCVGNTPQTVQMRFGCIGLDRFKDWITDLPEADVTYPRAYLTPEIAEEIKKSLDKHPDRSILSTYYVISGNPQHADKHAKDFLGGFSGPRPKWSPQGLSHYRQAGQLKRAHLADDALACPELDPELRRKVRKWLALWSYLMSDPDFNPRGAGVHLGNNNMTINRTVALGYFAALLPDHPRYDYWMQRYAEYVRFKLASQTAPDGTWVACPNYQLYGPTRFLDAAVNLLRNTGVADLTPLGYNAAVLRYTANLTMPDGRFDGRRIVPGMGNGSNRVETIFGFGMRAAGTQSYGFLRKMHRLSVGDGGVARARSNSPFYAFNYVPGEPDPNAKLETVFFPTYGVMFRNHFATKNETAMLFRAGINWSHWDTDTLNVILYGKGAPLSPGTGYGYGPGTISADNAIYHNRVKPYKHDMKVAFGRVDTGMRDYGFGPSADYAMAQRYYPPEQGGDGKERRWRRHVLFLKSNSPAKTSYFVMRDTFPGNPKTDPSWWTWLNLGEADMISVDGKAFDPQTVPHNENPVLAGLPVIKGRALDMKSLFGGNTHIWFANEQPLDFRPRLTFSDGPGTKTILEGMAGPGNDYFYVVWPRRDEEKPPPCKRLSENCIRITADDSTDYVFISGGPAAFEQEGGIFSGRAGTVRVFKDRVALCLNSGAGRVGYKGHILEGNGPFERVVPLAGLEPGVHKTGGYEKKRITIDLGNGVSMEGEGPFDASLKDGEVRIQTDGRARILRIVHDHFFTRPQYYVDGQEWMACWTDWPGSGFGRWKRSCMTALSVPAGRHGLVVGEMRFPPVWERAFTPLIEGVVVE